MPGRFDATDYIGVWDRLDLAVGEVKAIHPNAPQLLTDVYGYIQVMVVLNDERSATGTAFFMLGSGGKGAQATNPLEDAETSALGRALRMLGYATSRASLEEMQRIPQQGPHPRQPAVSRPAIPGITPEQADLMRRFKVARDGLVAYAVPVPQLKSSDVAGWSLEKLSNEVAIAEAELQAAIEKVAGMVEA